MKLNIFRSDDNQTIFEWISKSARFGLWFDRDGCDWFFAQKKAPADDVGGEHMTREQLIALCDEIKKALGEAGQ